MDTQRRLLLKSIALGGISGCLGWVGSGTALAAARQTQSAGLINPVTTLLLVNRKAEYSAFLQGARVTGNTNIKIYDLDSERDFLSSLQRHISGMSTEGLIVTGLADDAHGTLIIDQARSLGACMRWLGQHTVESGQSRHLLYSSEIAGDRGGLFGRRLASHGFSCISEGGRMREGQPLYEPVLYTREGGTEDLQWSMDLGFALVGNDPADFSNISQIDSNSIVPLNGHFISFTFEI
ncbi:hypothetical protein [Nitrosomonas sp.]|uniref:hypothetical protein n=1 Tax=Nitrosomonas sp. TaxID=42353 RepID=UPI0025F6A6D7|nr:hypothetical protein [Nitrosomonas sp.]MCC6917504.1 hypothetical protein [Nitrosomonas sp.]